MKQKLIVGIDISKKVLDVCIQPTGATFQITNNLAGFRQLKSQLDLSWDILLVMEHTGLYSLKLEQFLHTHNLAFCKVAALEIKRSIGMVRGKSDSVDAERIAEYAWLRKDKLIAAMPVDKNLAQLRQILRLRAKLVKDRSGFLNRLKELKAAGVCTSSDELYKIQISLIKTFSSKISILEEAMLEIIKADGQLKKNFDLLCTIKGVGKIISLSMIASTLNFKRFQHARQFNCYAGLAPFKHESGSSIKARTRVSHMANKDMKTLLNLSAFCAIRCNKELKQYYKKRVAEGKNKMSCINIIRAKIVARMFAVVKSQQPYQELQIAA